MSAYHAISPESCSQSVSSRDVRRAQSLVDLGFDIGRIERRPDGNAWQRSIDEEVARVLGIDLPDFQSDWLRRAHVRRACRARGIVGPEQGFVGIPERAQIARSIGVEPGLLFPFDTIAHVKKCDVLTDRDFRRLIELGGQAVPIGESPHLTWYRQVVDNAEARNKAAAERWRVESAEASPTIGTTRNAEPLDFTGLKAKRPAEPAPVFIGTVTTEERIEHAPHPANPNAGIRSVSYANEPVDLIEAEEEVIIAQMTLDPELVAIARRFEWVMSNRVVPALIGLALAIFSQGLWA